jgi:hypothetical protein
VWSCGDGRHRLLRVGHVVGLLLLRGLALLVIDADHKPWLVLLLVLGVLLGRPRPRGSLVCSVLLYYIQRVVVRILILS